MCSPSLSPLLDVLDADALEAVASAVASESLATFAQVAWACATAARIVWRHRFLQRWPQWQTGLQGSLFACGLGTRSISHDMTLDSPEPRRISPADTQLDLSYAATANGEGLFVATARDRLGDDCDRLYVWAAQRAPRSVLEMLFGQGQAQAPCEEPRRLVARGWPLPWQARRVAIGHGSIAVATESGDFFLTHLAPLPAGPLAKVQVQFPVADVCLGHGQADFAILLGMAGELATFGDNSQGQLATGDDVRRDAPVRTGTDHQVPFAGIAAGMNHVVVVDTTGHALSCGDNRRGQLGRTFHVGWSDFNWNRVLRGYGVTQVGAGFNLSAMVTASGSLFTFGQCNEGGLGHGGQQLAEEAIPRSVFALADHRVVSVAVGDGHMVALTETGRAFSWGLNDDGQCGNECQEGDERLGTPPWPPCYAPEVTLVPLPGPVQSVSAGFASCFVLGLHGPPVQQHIVPDQQMFSDEDEDDSQVWLDEEEEGEEDDDVLLEEEEDWEGEEDDDVDEGEEEENEAEGE